MASFFRILALRGISLLPPMILQIVILFFYYMYMTTYLLPMMITTGSFTQDLDNIKGLNDLKNLNWNRGAIYFVVLHLLIFLFLVSYLRAMFTAPGTVPKVRLFKLISEEWSQNTMEQLVEEYIRTRKSNSANLFANLLNKETVKNINVNDKDFRNFLKNTEFRYCDYCKHFKPKRTHHCRQCGECVLKMDHHCNWLYNCIGLKNYKFFLVFLIYANVLLLFMILTYTECISKFYMDSKVTDLKFFLIAFSFFLNASFVVIIVSFSSFHFGYLVKENKTTLEFCEKSHQDTNFNLGMWKNWVAIFGKNPLFWFLPICPTRESGIEYKDLNELGDEGFKLLDAKEA